jgi:hypothetical protein
MDFFFLPDEEKQILASLYHEQGLHLIKETMDYPLEINNSNIRSIKLELDEPRFWQIQIIIWDKDIVEKPILREIKMKSGKRTEVDFIRTGGVLFEPSVIIRPNILLEGRLATMGPSEYERHGMDSKKIKAMYNIILKELRRHSDRKAKVFLKRPDGTLLPVRGEIASPGALDWCKKGNLLKQFPEGGAEFYAKRVED